MKGIIKTVIKHDKNEKQYAKGIVNYLHSVDVHRQLLIDYCPQLFLPPHHLLKASTTIREIVLFVQGIHLLQARAGRPRYTTELFVFPSLRTPRAAKDIKQQILIYNGRKYSMLPSAAGTSRTLLTSVKQIFK